MLDGDESVARETARTEVLARAFADAAGGFFERRKEYEDVITEAENEQDRMKKYGIGAAVVGVVLAIFGIAENTIALTLFGLLVGVAIGAYAYKQYTEAEERIEEHERKLQENEPDGEVSFVSQIAVPFYLVPYADRFMIFDGLDTARETRLELAHIDGDALVDTGERLTETQSAYDSLVQQGTASADAVTDFASDADTHRRPEQPVIDDLEELTGIAADIDRDVIEVAVHANDEKSESLRTFATNGQLERNGNLPTIGTSQSLGECEAEVDSIRGVEEEATSGDLLDTARSERKRVTRVCTDITERLRANRPTVETHYDEHAAAVETTTHKHVCGECLANRIEDVVDELDLVQEILSGDAGGSLGAALGDPDLQNEYPEFSDRIEADLQEKIPRPSEALAQAYNTLPDLGPDGGFCENGHDRVETYRVPESGAVFGETWRSLYYAFREPILESAADLERDAEEMRQNKEQKMLDLTQYEQIKEQTEQRYQEVESEYEVARKLEAQLGR
jgi:hypothetical protein